MSHTNQLTILIRIAGLYFLWLAVLTLFTFFLMGLTDGGGTSISEMLNVFSGQSRDEVYLFRTVGTSVLINSIVAVVLIKWAGPLAKWLTKGIPDSKFHLLPARASESTVTILHVVGVVFFVVTLKDLFKIMPRLLMVEQSLINPLFLISLVQLFFAVFIVMKAHSIARFIERLGK